MPHTVPVNTADWGDRLEKTVAYRLTLFRRSEPTVEAQGRLWTSNEGNGWRKVGALRHSVTSFLPSRTPRRGNPSASQGNGKEGDEDRWNPPEPRMKQVNYPYGPCTGFSTDTPWRPFVVGPCGAREVSLEHVNGSLRH